MAERAPIKARIRRRLLSAVAGAALAVILLATGASWRLDTWIYDAFAQSMAARPDPRIVLVEIDSASLERIGAWPWSRRVHARLLDRLTDAGVRGVALDVLLSEPALSDPEGDALLARAIERSGKVVLPVHAAASADGGAAVELLPIREFAASAAALGHMDRARDADGGSRSLYLRAGAGTPQWPALALAMQQLGEPEGLQMLPAMPDAAGPDEDARWRQEQRVMLPRAHGRDAYSRFPYADVLQGRVADAGLRGRWVLVSPVVAGLGADASAAGDPPAANVDYQLGALDALVGQRSVQPLSMFLQILLSIVLVTLPLLITGLPHLRALERALLIAGASTLLLTWLLLRWGQVWFPPGAALLALALACAAWAAYRLRGMRRSGQTDPLTGLANRQMFQDALQHELRWARRSEQPLSLLLVELDRSKDAAQTSTGVAIEAMLQAVAENLRSRARRPRDLVARVDEWRFAVLLPETTRQAAAAIATTIHVDLANHALDSADPAVSGLTTSIGMHTAQGDEELAGTGLLDKADAARARAGLAGGSRTCSYAEIAQSRR